MTPAPPPDTTGTFPLRVAAIDVGSNAIRFVAVEFTEPERYTVIEQSRAPVRLGHQVFVSGRLPTGEAAAAVEAIGGFGARIKTLEVSRSRAVATSAVRDARNAEEFLERVRQEAGVRLETISGAEEARLVHLAVRHRMPLGDHRWVLVDLGGGSVELSVVDAERIYWSASHDMGSVRLLEELERADEEPGRFRQRLEEYTARLRIPEGKRGSAPVGIIATGGNIEALARLAGCVPDASGVSVLPRSKLHDLIRELASRSYRQRMDELQLRADRADVILPAAVVYETLCRHAGFGELHVPHVGLKDGVVLDLADDYARHGTHLRRQDHLVQAGALALGRRYRFDQPHARQVTRLALSLFDQLTPLHGLGLDERRILLAAGLLHDIGDYIAYRKHHKHSLYIILHSELAGLSTREQRLVANVARYHRKGGPVERHQEYVALDAEDRKRVDRLASLLRVADALDRDHLQKVKRVEAAFDAAQVTLSVWGGGELESWAVDKKGGLFSSTFGRALKLRLKPIRE